LGSRETERREVMPSRAPMGQGRRAPWREGGAELPACCRVPWDREKRFRGRGEKEEGCGD
jgi:hypothetical protein